MMSRGFALHPGELAWRCSHIRERVRTCSRGRTRNLFGRCLRMRTFQGRPTHAVPDNDRVRRRLAISPPLGLCKLGHGGGVGSMMLVRARSLLVGRRRVAHRSERCCLQWRVSEPVAARRRRRLGRRLAAAHSALVCRSARRLKLVRDGRSGTVALAARVAHPPGSRMYSSGIGPLPGCRSNTPETRRLALSSSPALPHRARSLEHPRSATT